MNPVQLDQLTLDGLRDLARSLSLETSGVKAVLMERISMHYDRVGWPEGINIRPPESNGAITPVSITDQPSLDRDQLNLAGSSRQDQPRNSRDVSRDTMYPSNLQEIIRCAIQSYKESRRTRPNTNSKLPRQLSGSSVSASCNTAVSSVYDWKQIKFAKNTIPAFSGKDDENIRRWIDRVAAVARIYNIPNESLVLAASLQLKDRALKWYHRQPIESVSTWDDFAVKFVFISIKENHTL